MLPAALFIRKNMNLKELGWNAWFEDIYSKMPGKEKLILARITAEFAGCYGAETEKGSCLLSLSGKIKHRSESAAGIPVVGDWVLAAKDEKAERLPVYCILKRRTLLSRRAAGRLNAIQPIAANADYVFIVQGLDGNYNLKRLDRYLTAVKTSGVQPVIILNKADLCTEFMERKKAAEAVSGGIPVIVLESLHHNGYESLSQYMQPGITVAFIGSSGVGKSTIINELGAEKQRTGQVKAKDGKGIHTTTTRRLLRLKNGALLVDTPGMKEFAAWEASAGFKENFADIETLALQCRFSNCRHDTEPDCAVKKAVLEGKISVQRLDNYKKLKEEMKAMKKRRQSG